MRRIPRILPLLLLVTIMPVLAGCADGDYGDFDMDKLDIFGLNKKKPLPGKREDVFPNGVPGVTQGIPPEYTKGYQEKQQQEAAAAAAQAEVAEREKKAKAEAAAKAKAAAEARAKARKRQHVVKRKAKPKPKPAPQPAAQQPQQSPWPSSGQTQQQQKQDSPWPSAPPAGTFSR